MTRPTATLAAMLTGFLVCECAHSEAADTPFVEGPPSSSARVFVPRAGYVELFRQRFGQIRAGESDRKMEPNGAPLTDSANRVRRIVPVILVDFEDMQAPFPRASYQFRLFGDPADEGTDQETGARTLKNYYRAMSLNAFTVDGVVMGWYRMPKRIRDYQDADKYPKTALIVDALKAANDDKTFKFGEFDNDGADDVPNSNDDDGIVDTVFIIHAGYPSENGNDPKSFRSHSYNLTMLEPQKAAFETRSDRVRVPGTKILVDDYVLLPGLSGQKTTNHTPPRPQITEIGVMCHEFGHALGLPDLYDRTKLPIYSHAVGRYCLMGMGVYGVRGTSPESPVSLSAWCKYYLGWADFKTLKTGDSPHLSPVHVGNKVLKIDVPGSNHAEYFLIEYRARPSDTDTIQRIDWDKDFWVSGAGTKGGSAPAGGSLSGTSTRELVAAARRSQAPPPLPRPPMVAPPPR
jgi:M6 family metalloprotease-like protein